MRPTHAGQHTYTYRHTTAQRAASRRWEACSTTTPTAPSPLPLAARPPRKVARRTRRTRGRRRWAVCSRVELQRRTRSLASRFLGIADGSLSRASTRRRADGEIWRHEHGSEPKADAGKLAQWSEASHLRGILLQLLQLLYWARATAELEQKPRGECRTQRTWRALGSVKTRSRTC